MIVADACKTVAGNLAHTHPVYLYVVNLIAGVCRDGEGLAAAIQNADIARRRNAAPCTCAGRDDVFRILNAYKGGVDRMIRGDAAEPIDIALF